MSKQLSILIWLLTYTGLPLIKITLEYAMTTTDKQEAWQKAREKLAQMRADGWKPVHLSPVEAAKAKPNSLKMAIRAHCYTCVGEDADPGYKARVRDCSVVSCALHPHRPWQDHSGRVQHTEEGIRFEDDGADASAPEADEA